MPLYPGAPSSPWIPYTPVVTGGGTAPSWTFSSQLGAYQQNNRTVSGWIRLIVATTPTVGTGLMHLSLPVAADASLATINPTCASGWIFNGTVYIFTGFINTTTDMSLFISSATYQVTLDGNPFTWAAGGQVDCMFQYQAAA